MKKSMLQSTFIIIQKNQDKNFKNNNKKKQFNQTIDTKKDLLFIKKKFKKELKKN